jgi:hypothetical protein
MTAESQHSLISKLKPGRIILPVILGLGVVVWFILKEINSDVLSKLNFTWRSVFWLFVAWLCMACRDLGYIIRIRILTDKDLSWRQAFRVIMLWEFSSAILPSTVGGTTVAVVYLNKEGISVGRSTSIVLATSFLDELYFVIMLPLILLLVGSTALFTTHNTAGINELKVISAVGYSVIFAWVIIVGYGLFFNPEGIRKLILNIFRLPFIRRWQSSAVKAGDDIVESSRELRKHSFSFWAKAGTATFLSWTARYWVINAILVAFFSINDHFLIFARQLVTWIMMIISPTPGGSGFAELIMSRYISDLIPADPVIAGSIALAMAIIWRVISYYPYLIVGALILPGWIERKFIQPISKKK